VKTLLTLGMAGAVATTIAACGSSAPSSAPSAGASAHHSMHHAMTQLAMVGSDCGMLPASGMGSPHSMSMEPLVTAAAHNPLISAFATEVRSAGLVSELNSMHPITVFAPDNTAFHKLTGAQMTMMHGRAELTKILKYHVVNGTVTPAELASGKPLTTLEGSTLQPSRMGSVYEVNSADVTCGNIHAENATVYVINKVLEPMH
jgi:uncharacterized surface protein with fasciclin (FAS1) repeats